MTVQLHPLNRDFAWRDCGSSHALTRAQVESWNERGFLVIEQFVSPDERSRIESEIDRLEQASEAALRRLSAEESFIARADEVTFASHLVKRSAVLREFVRSEAMCAVVRDLVGPEARLFWDHSVYKKAHSRNPFPWHQDNGYTFVEPQQYLTTWLALSDTDARNGCIWVAPGWHRRGTLRHRESRLGHTCFDVTPSDAIAVPVPAGALVVFSTVTPHYTGPNYTDHTRKAYVAQYAPEGALQHVVDPTGHSALLPATAPDRQFPVLRHGARVAA